MVERNVDPYGRIEVGIDTVFESRYRSGPQPAFFVQESEAVDLFNALCFGWDKPQHVLSTLPAIAHSPAEEHARRQRTWLIPEEIRQIDVREMVLALCDTDAQRDRVNEEMDLFEQHDMLPILHVMVYLIAYFRHNGTVWGVGRGSSVASYVLYRLGVHKVDSLKYGLDIREFLKD